MRHPFVFLPLLALCLGLFGACAHPKEGVNPGAMARGTHGPRTMYKGEYVSTLEVGVESTTVFADGNGGVVLVPGVPHSRNPNYADAREIKLKVRELAEQLVADMNDCSLQGTVALPTAFVNLNDFEETSTFGRLVGEQLFHELNQRGYPVREYRIAGSVRVKKAGEFSLSRALGNVNARNSVVIVGTYSVAPEAVFINARLVRPTDGKVLRTANLVFENNPTLAKMMHARSGSGLKVASGESGMRIRDFETAVRPEPPKDVTPFDRGEDIH